MKTLVALPLLFIALSLLILPNPTHSIRNNPIRLPTAAHVVALASDDVTPVVDIDGHELQPTGDYYIFTPDPELGQGVVGLSRDANKCPIMDVILSTDSSADPVIITPADPNATQVLESTFQSFKFNASVPLCGNNVFWESHYDIQIGQHILQTGNASHSPFLIERAYPDAGTDFPIIYKITYCLDDDCYNVGTYYDTLIHARRLVLSRESFLPVVFQKRTPPVLDHIGDQLLAGDLYNILSIDDPEGEVALVRLEVNNDTCPSDVIIHDELGDPIIFQSWGPAFVLESTLLTIKFKPLQPTPNCTENVYWDSQPDPSTGQIFVKATSFFSKLFKIEKVPSPDETYFYKIMYCPPATPCYNVSTYKDTRPSVNATRLVLTYDIPHPFTFKKVITL
ncbi:PREDICTED: sporamin B-like [Ipomoea nil]|uniref:sporamin B-like n=1 Tax=Ipomoea nil TaxID=35883 RepID=UPI000902015F|nr:PREDICTED: sporamin B-like [Ipomoea nil]